MIDTSDSVLVVLFVLLNIQLVQCVIELIALSAREILVPVRSTVMGALVKALFASVMMTLLTLFNLCGWLLSPMLRIPCIVLVGYVGGIGWDECKSAWRWADGLYGLGCEWMRLLRFMTGMDGYGVICMEMGVLITVMVTMVLVYVSIDVHGWARDTPKTHAPTAEQWQIFVNTNRDRKAITLNVVQSSIVADVIEAIRQKGIHIGTSFLTLHGKPLTNKQMTLLDYGIQAESTLSLSPAPGRGGSGRPKRRRCNANVHLTHKDRYACTRARTHTHTRIYILRFIS